MDYTRFTTEELVLDNYFQRWVNQQLPPEDSFWEEWLGHHPEKADEVSQAKFVLKALEMDRVAPDDRLMAGQIGRILSSLPENPAPRGQIFRSLWLRVAAMLVLAGGIGWYVFQNDVFDRKPEHLIKTLVENPVIIQSSTNNTGSTEDFIFNNTPVNRVFDILEKSYGVTIVYDREMLDGCTVTAPLGNETLYEKLDLVCKVIRASYEVVDAQVIVSSKGCM